MLDISIWLEWEFLPYLMTAIAILGTMKLIKLLIMNRGD